MYSYTYTRVYIYAHTYACTHGFTDAYIGMCRYVIDACLRVVAFDYTLNSDLARLNDRVYMISLHNVYIMST